MTTRRTSSFVTAALAVASALVIAWPAAARAHGASEASALSMLPVAVSVAAPVAVLSAGAALTVVSVEASAAGTVWVLESAADGTRASLRFAGHVAGGVSVAAGTAVAVTAVSTGWVLSNAGQAIAFVPNAIGRALLHDERVAR